MQIESVELGRIYYSPPDTQKGAVQLQAGLHAEVWVTIKERSVSRSVACVNIEVIDILAMVKQHYHIKYWSIIHHTAINLIIPIHSHLKCVSDLFWSQRLHTLSVWDPYLESLKSQRWSGYLPDSNSPVLLVLALSTSFLQRPYLQKVVHLIMGRHLLTLAH